MRIASRSGSAPEIVLTRRHKAEVLTLLGSNDAGITELRAIHESGYALGYRLRVDPAWEPLRSDPKFQQLMKEAEARADAQPRAGQARF